MISIKKGKEHPLKIPQFVCDKPLRDDSPPPFNMLVNAFKMIVFLGRPGSGKTSLMSALFRDKKCFKKTWDNVVLVCPKTSLASMKPSDNPFKKLSLEKWHEDLSNIDEIYDQIRHYADEGETTCLVLDDVMSQLKDGYIEKRLTHLAANRRHLKCSIICLSQLYERIPLKVRKLINTIVVLYRPSKKEMFMIGDELLELRKELSEQVYKICFDKQHDFMMIDVPSQRIFHNSDELIINEEINEAEPGAGR